VAALLRSPRGCAGAGDHAAGLPSHRRACPLDRVGAQPKATIESSQMIALAVAAQARLDILPQVPTIAEAALRMPEIDAGLSRVSCRLARDALTMEPPGLPESVDGAD
jgi:hypothetical protein